MQLFFVIIMIGDGIVDRQEYLKYSLADRSLIESAYGNRKNGCSGDIYNFDLQPLINNFSFYDFIIASRQNSGSYEHGGFLVVTDKQYILGYNSDYGKGSHTASFARCMADLEGGKQINGYQDCLYFSNRCQKSLVTARFVYEKVRSNENGYPIFRGNIMFCFGSTPLTLGMLSAFEQFYNDYADEIKGVQERYGFSIEYSYVENNFFHSEKDTTLENVLKFARSRVNYEASNELGENEIIIGKVPEESVKNIKH